MSEIKYFAEKVNGHASARLAGTVLVVNMGVLNKTHVRGWGAPKGQARALPVETWISPRYLEKNCVEVSEETAREIHPFLFECIAKYKRSPEYRVGHWLEAKHSPIQNDAQAQKDSTEKFYDLYGN